MTAVASLRGIRKAFGDTTALANVDLELRQGEILALLGPNGAGKTTTLDIAVGLRRPDDGTALLFGCDPREARPRLKIGVTPQESGVPQLLRVGEVIDLVRAHFPRPASARETLDRFGLSGLERRQAGGLSGGEKRRLAVALAFAGSPEAVFLDEPTTGLDVETRRAVWSTIRDYVGGGGTVLLTTHYLEEAEALASRIVVLRGGRVVADGSVAETRDRLGTVRVRVRADAVPELPGVALRERRGDRWTLDCPNGDAFVRALVCSGIPFRSLEVERMGLEEVFLTLTEAEP